MRPSGSTGPPLDRRETDDEAKPSPRASRVNRITVGRERTIGFMGEEARTYGTPSMILDIEHTCRELILEHADAGEDSVGMEVAIKHLAPTLMGMTVEIAVRVTAVEGRKVLFEATVKDEPRHRRHRQPQPASWSTRPRRSSA